jgi:hypothetical protein
MAVEDLRQSPMMGHMLDALENGEDIGHYGRLDFAMIGRHFLDNDELVGLLTQDYDVNEQEIKALVQQVQERATARPGGRRSWSTRASRTSPSARTQTTRTPATRTRSCSSRTRYTSRSRSTGGEGVGWRQASVLPVVGA